MLKPRCSVINQRPRVSPRFQSRLPWPASTTTINYIKIKTQIATHNWSCSTQASLEHPEIPLKTLANPFSLSMKPNQCSCLSDRSSHKVSRHFFRCLLDRLLFSLDFNFQRTHCRSIIAREMHGFESGWSQMYNCKMAVHAFKLAKTQLGALLLDHFQAVDTVCFCPFTLTFSRHMS